MKTKLTRILLGIAALVVHAGMAAAAETQLPKECQQPRLSKEVQRFCDQLQFADVPHYHVVRYAPTGAVRSVHLIDTKTGRALVTSYPYGIKFAILDELTPGESDREVRVRTRELEGALKGRPTPAGQTPPSPAGFATGLPIGWNSSTGPTSGQCLNYTIATPSNNVEQASFSSESAAHSTAQQVNVSATVSLSFDAFQASDSFSFSDQWQSSTNSTSQYYNFYSLYTLNTTVPMNDPLTDQGKAHIDPVTKAPDDSFNTLCGSDYLASVPVGMVATMSLNYGSTSKSAETSITNELNLSFGLDSVSTAVSTSNKQTDSSSYFTFSMIHYGGGTGASHDLNTAFAMVNSAGDAFYALCARGDAAACTQFASNMGTGAAAALASFNTLVAGLSGATNPDLSFLQTFPHAVAGVSRESVTTPIPLNQASNEVLNLYKAQLEDYVALVNQISTLRNRVRSLEGLFDDEPDLNPALILDIVSYLNILDDTYTDGRRKLLKDLGNCLAATSDNVTSVCKSIIENKVKNAFEYYGPDGPSNDFFAQQNTLALQYTSLTQAQGGPPVPGDVIYINELPSFAAIGGAPIAGEAGFVNFVDRPFPTPGGQIITPGFEVLALEPDEPLSTNSVSTKVRNDPTKPSPFTLWIFELFDDTILFHNTPGATFSSTSCTPTFARPCAINYLVPATAAPRLTVEHRQIVDLFTAD